MDKTELEKKEQDWRARIKALSESVWEGHAKEQAVKDWLAGFTGIVCDSHHEKLYAQYLLQQFIYFGKNEIRSLLYALFRDHILYPIVQNHLELFPSATDEGLRSEINRLMHLTKIAPVGNVSESGSILAYGLAKEAGLPTTSILSVQQILGQVDNGMSVEHVILIDDFLGTGVQVSETHAPEIIKLKQKNIKVAYIALVALIKGIENLKEGGLFDAVNGVIVMDETYSLNSKECLFFEDIADLAPLKPAECLKVVSGYGDKLLPGLPLGHGACGVMVGFEHNTQDNSVPIFWVKSQNPQWEPIFPRFNKTYQFKA